MIPSDILAAIVTHARQDWPKEACGFVLSQAGVHVPERSWLHLPARNVQDMLHSMDPAVHTRTADQGYAVDAETLLEVALRRRAGDRLELIYHSHTRAWGANFSDEDRRGALGGLAAPQFPEAEYLVVSMQANGAWMARRYRWDGHAFTECG